MRFLGTCLVVLACIGFGLGLCGTRLRRIRVLRELERALGLLAGELGTSVRPTETLCALLARRCAGDVGSFFQSVVSALPTLAERPFAEIWEEAALCSLGCLRAEEQALVAGLGGSLGRFELARQLEAVELCREEIRSALREAKSAYPAEKKLCLGLSVSAAAMLAILLL